MWRGLSKRALICHTLLLVAGAGLAGNVSALRAHPWGQWLVLIVAAGIGLRSHFWFAEDTRATAVIREHWGRITILAAGSAAALLCAAVWGPHRWGITAGMPVIARAAIAAVVPGMSAAAPHVLGRSMRKLTGHAARLGGVDESVARVRVPRRRPARAAIPDRAAD